MDILIKQFEFKWTCSIVAGDLPEDFLKVTEPTASVTSWGEKSKGKPSDEETASLLNRHSAGDAAAAVNQMPTPAATSGSAGTHIFQYALHYMCKIESYVWRQF